MQTLQQHAERILRYYNTCGALEYCHSLLKGNMPNSCNLCLTKEQICLGVLFVVCRKARNIIDYSLTNELVIDSIDCDKSKSQWNELQNTFFDVHKNEIYSPNLRTSHPDGLCSVGNFSNYLLRDVMRESHTISEPLFDTQRYLVFCAFCAAASVDINKQYRVPWYWLVVVDPDLGESFFSKILYRCQIARDNNELELIQEYFVEMKQHLETCANQQEDSFSVQFNVLENLLKSKYTQKEDLRLVNTLLGKIKLLIVDLTPPRIKPSQMISILLNFAKKIGEICLDRKANIRRGFSDLLVLAHS